MSVYWTLLLEALNIAQVVFLYLLIRRKVPSNTEAIRLLEIATDTALQFNPSSAESLRQVVDRLDQVAINNTAAAEVLKENLEIANALAQEDRQQMTQLMILLAHVSSLVTTGVAGVQRIEKGTLAVSDDLSKAHERAEAVPGGNPGEAADAAMKRE